MTNADKYLKDGVDIIDFTCEFANYLYNHQGELLSKNKKAPREQLHVFLTSETKPTISEDEKVILSKIDRRNFDRIGRYDDCLYLKGGTCYGFEDGKDKGVFNYLYHELFQFIKERRRI